MEEREKEEIDLVSREAVKTMLNDIGGCDAKEEWAKGWDSAIDESIRRLNKIESINMNDWIHVSEHKPDSNEVVQITLSDGGYTIGWYDQEDDSWWNCFYMAERIENEKVVAWMPRPKQYRPKQK